MTPACTSAHYLSESTFDHAVARSIACTDAPPQSPGVHSGSMLASWEHPTATRQLFSGVMAAQGPWNDDPTSWTTPSSALTILTDANGSERPQA